MIILLTQKEIDSLVKLISTGKNTYKDISENFPYLSGEDLIDIIGDDFSSEREFSIRALDRHISPILFFINTPDKYEANYIFKLDDSFELSVYGENILYQLEKERQQEDKTNEAICWAKYATLLTFIGLIYQFIASEKSNILYLLQLISELMQQAF